MTDQSFFENQQTPVITIKLTSRHYNDSNKQALESTDGRLSFTLTWPSDREMKSPLI